MIYTITLNPAVDRTIMLNNFKINSVNRAEKILEDAGGKGINVSKMIKNLNGDSKALGIVGGIQGLFIKQQLDKMGILHEFVESDKNTRINLKIVDSELQTFTDINEKGTMVLEETIEKVEEKLFSLLKENDILILAGSIPNGCDKNIYKKWIQKANLINVKVILDGDGELLKNGVIAGPYIVKPNIHELERLFNTNIESLDDIIYYGKKILENGIYAIVVSRGEKGCLLITQDKVWEYQGFKVDVKSTVGAGDAMVGGIAYGIEKGESLEEAVKIGVASSTSSIQKEGTTMGNYEEVMDLKRKVVQKLI